MERKINVRPIVTVAAALCLGQYFAYSGIKYGFTFYVILLFVAFIACLILPLFFKKGRKLKAFVLFVITAVFLFLGFFNVLKAYANFNKADIVESDYSVTGKVDCVNYDGDDYKCVILRSLKFNGKNIKTNYKLKLYLYDDVSLKRGDLLTFTAKISNYSAYYENKPSVDNIVNKIKYTATVDEYSYVFKGSAPTVFDSGYNFISKNLKSGLQDSEYPIALAMITGDDSFMNDEVLSAFRQGGVAHIFAVSGLHIGFLATALSLIFRKRTLVKTIIIPCVLFFYSGICCFTASSVRAAVMFSVALISSRSGEKYDSLSSLSLSAIFVLIFEPFQLFTAGFILSFSVVFSMLTVGRRISNALSFLPEKLAKSLGGVISAQVGSIPASLYFFKTFSLIAPAVNLITIPIISYVFIFIVLGIVFGGVFSIPNYTLLIQNYCVKIIRKIFLVCDFDAFMINDVYMGKFVLVYFAIMIVFAGMINFSRKKRVVTSVILSFVLILGSAYTTVLTKNTMYFAVTHSNGFDAVAFCSKNKTSVVISNSEYPFGYNNLVRFLNSHSLDCIDELFIADKSIDVYSTVNIMYGNVKINEVIYSSEDDQNSLSGYFADRIKFNQCFCGESYDGILGRFFFVDDGIAVFECSKISVLFDSGCEDYLGITADVLVSSDVLDDADYNFFTILSYYNHPLYVNCYTDGNLIYKIDKGKVKRC